MTGRRTILLFWALFLVPTLIVTALAFQLLSHEQDRLNRTAMETLFRQAESVADTIHLTLQAVRDNMGRSLLQLSPDHRLQTLQSWEATNPLIRNLFVKPRDKQPTYPVPGMASTAEERRFINRYEALFSGRLAFDFNEQPALDSPGNMTSLPPSQTAAANAPISGKPSTLYTPYPSQEKEITQKVHSEKENLLALSRGSRQAVSPATAIQPPIKGKNTLPETGMTEKSGWIPWFSENRLFILIWAQKEKNAPVYGVELELMTLLSRLVVEFPSLSSDTSALVLMDGNGHAMHQSGGLDISSSAVPRTTFSVSPLLPHWKIALYTDETGISTTRGFLYLSCLLLGIFLAAIVTGGGLLTRLTLKNMKDARQKTSFVASVSHELKTPLTSIRMYAELLQSERIKDPDKRRHYLSVMVSESRRLTRLINNVLDFGRLEQGKKQYHKRAIDLRELLNQIIDAHRLRIQQHGLEIITQFNFDGTSNSDNNGQDKNERGYGDGDGDENRNGREQECNFTLTSDPDALEQVILNLMDNALKYARNGKFIRFVLKKEYSAAATGDMILLKVCDGGAGIPPKHHEAIFEKFHRVDNTLTATHPGSGLGLSISRKILRDLGGDLVLEPNPTGPGCCFTARIKP